MHTRQAHREIGRRARGRRADPSEAPWPNLQTEWGHVPSDGGGRLQQTLRDGKAGALAGATKSTAPVCQGNSTHSLLAMASPPPHDEAGACFARAH